MKLTISQIELDKLLEITRHAVPTKPINPSLANLLLVCDSQSQELTVTAFDLRLGIRAMCSCNVESGGTIALPAKLLSEVVSHLPQGDIIFEIDSNKVILTHCSGKCQIQSLNAQEFPALPSVEGTPVEMPLAKLQQLIKATLFAASRDETKQVIAGVHFQFGASGIDAAATDGHQLAIANSTTSTPSNKKTAEATIPYQPLVEIEKLLGNVSGESNCTITIGRAIASFDLPNVRVTTRLLEGQYPPYATLIPQQFDYQFIVERKSFDAALKRVAIVAENQNNTAKIVFDTKNQEATISTQSHNVGGAVESVLIRANSISTNKFYVGFNLKYLINALKYISSSEIIIKANRPTTPVIITPVNGNLDQLVLVMPLDLTNTWIQEIESGPAESSTAQHETALVTPQTEEVAPEVPQDLEISVAQTSQTQTLDIETLETEISEVSTVSPSAVEIHYKAIEPPLESTVTTKAKTKPKSNKTPKQAA